MIINNPEMFGTGFNDATDEKKRHMQTLLITNNCGNDFVNSMTGCPIQKVHKMKTKKREKLKKYLVEASTIQEKYTYHSKTKLQNGSGVSITTTPDYNYYKVINPQKMKFKEDIIKQLSSNKRKIENDQKINYENDSKFLNFLVLE